MSTSWEHYIIAVVLFMIFDVCWLKFYFNKPYFIQVQEVQGSPLILRWKMGKPAYAFMILALLVITVPNIDDSTTSLLFQTSAQFGNTLGAAVYGTYAFTCGSIYTNFKVSIAIQDTVWGIFIYTIVPLITFALAGLWS